ncbi:MAG: hypothetical protein Q8S15_07140 [Erysipelotrichaceae bacterium]|nr:hypothetical protein [Erysipelotrichaceae bacterium]
MKIGLLAVGFPNFRYDYAQKNLDISIKKLISRGISLFGCEKVLIEESMIFDEIERLKSEQVDVMIIQCGTYSFGSVIYKIIDEMKEKPLILWGFTEPRIEGFRGLPLNSLCAVNMYSSFLKRLEKPFKYFYGAIDDEKMYNNITDYLKAHQLKLKLKGTKFCVIGGRVPGFYLSSVDELLFKREIGVEIVYYSLAELIYDMEKTSDEDVKLEVENIKRVSKVIENLDKYLKDTASMITAIKKYKVENKIDGFALKCWPDIQTVKKMSACGVVSFLNNDNIMVSCEGDITSLLTQFIQQQITNEPCFLADLVNYNENGSFKTWHCGPAPARIARDPEDVKITMHSTMKEYGVAMEFGLPISEVTVIKISELNQKYRMLIMSGNSVQEDRDMSANQSDILFNASKDVVLDTILNKGFEHHFCIVYKDIKKELLQFCDVMNIETIVI